jgi:hypothetical protein
VGSNLQLLLCPFVDADTLSFRGTGDRPMNFGIDTQDEPS